MLKLVSDNSGLVWDAFLGEYIQPGNEYPFILMDSQDIGIAQFETREKAVEFQLKEGISATTYIEDWTWVE
jgi:hypothetical protein